MKKLKEYSIQLIWDELKLIDFGKIMVIILRFFLVILIIKLREKYPEFFRKIMLRELLDLISFILIAPVYLIKAIIKIYKIINLFNIGINAQATVVDYIYSENFKYYVQDEEKGEKVGIKYQYIINDQIYENTWNDPNFRLGTKINVLANPKNKNDAIIKDLFVYAEE